MNSLVRFLREEKCPACGHHVAVPFLDPSLQPLATVAWPLSADEAEAMQQLPLDFVRCVECGHVFNAAFEYTRVPYSRKPHRMFNKGINWSENIQTMGRKILRRFSNPPHAVEIGHGDGSFLMGLAKEMPGGKYTGFDPYGINFTEIENVQFRTSLFEAKIHLPEIRPDLIISRHVLEHLIDPLEFIQGLSFAAACIGIQPILYIEVPCIDRAVSAWRTVDFYYEHNSQFTSASFQKMLRRCGVETEEIGHIYDGEVIYGFARLGVCQKHIRNAKCSISFRNQVREAELRIQKQVDELYHCGKTICIWGGTGKSAAFINRYKLDAKRFPLVVDSDQDKAGTYVPGTGQLIRFRDYLIEHPVQILIIPPQWRAKDILREMEQIGIRAEQILIEHNGCLTDYRKEDHPYK
ncbi:MAG: methyltransferase domain-containing protein [Desulfococcaceae bacterium]|jgi:hypothetical protein|nr:methyltransferase domain-containing protein [Desulfococcaceae bacterium]